MSDVLERVANAIHKNSTAGVPLMLARPEDRSWAVGAARAAIAAMPSWQPIETAPKDGRNEILVYCTDTEEAFVAFRSHGDWQYARTAFGDRICCRPTHWMALPAPPEVKP